MAKTWYDSVQEFHEAFHVPVADTPTLMEESRALARAGWMREEVDEFLEATTIAEQADAMIDLIYFAIGTMVEMGVRPENLFEIVQQANMSKLWSDGKPRFRESDGKILKPGNWVDPDPLLAEEILRQKGNS
jgi:predicted HAD superfamily Cof-like phosphohydrolase